MKNQILINNIYIDGNNLFRAAQELGFEIDYRKLYVWLRQKFHIDKSYIFIGFVESNRKFYEYLKGSGFNLIFKETVCINGNIKGNCDSEIILKVTNDFYTRNFDRCIILTGDGDFGCLIDFLHNSSVLSCVIAPNIYKCSFLIKNKNVETIFLNDLYHKFSNQIKKAPDADSSA